MHLALTHVPVILSLAGLTMLIVAFIIKSNTLTKTSYIIVLVAGIAALPVFFSGEGAEEAIENIPGVSEAVIERHEEVAKLAIISIAIAGVGALAALLSFKWQRATSIFKITVLLLALTSGGLMAQTAHLGGQIRHSEIRNGVALQNENEGGGANESTGSERQEKDDD